MGMAGMTLKSGKFTELYPAIPIRTEMASMKDLGEIQIHWIHVSQLVVVLDPIDDDD
jgi:hypothetical protein